MSEEVHEYKNGDMFRWHYTEGYIKAHADANNYLYWCKSCICAYKDGRFIDTYWSSGSDSVRFSVTDVGVRIELEFLGNMEDYRETTVSTRACYLDANFMDLRHANATGHNFYIRKDAVRDIEKMKRVMKRGIKDIKRDIEYQQGELRRAEAELENITLETYIFFSGDVSVHDVSYEDEEKPDEVS